MDVTAGSPSGTVTGVERSTCPSCGFVCLVMPDAAESPLRASRECYAAYVDLSVYGLERARSDFLHQETVDAYAARHPGPAGTPISTWFALVGLHLSLDQGRTGREVQRAHVRLGRRKDRWPGLSVPDDLRCMNAADVMLHPPGEPRDEALRRWAAEVWQRWTSMHVAIATLCAERGL